MKKVLFILFSLITSVVVAQTEENQATTTNGTITIEQDPRIPELINTHIDINKANNGKIAGWRVQIYNSSGTNSRTEAQNARKLFLSKYPDVGAYLIYQPPFFKIRVGDFRSKSEAYCFYKQLLPDFPVSYLISDQINYPKLQTKQEDETSDLDKLLEEVH
ncbi:MAG: SPOR domain-containing protein [Bacteroidales bacterium]|nr:SPOR domain-containing protein [Bacteroidales bacterium]